MEDSDLDVAPIGQFTVPAFHMEILSSNGPNIAQEVDKVGVSGTGLTLVVEGALSGSTLSSPSTDSVGVSSTRTLDIKEERVKVYVKRKRDGGSKDLRSPLKKQNVGTLPDFVDVEESAEMVIPLMAQEAVVRNVTEAMIIDSQGTLTETRESQSLPVLSFTTEVTGSIASCTTVVESSLDAGNHVSCQVVENCEAALSTEVASKVETTSSSVDCFKELTNIQQSLVTVEHEQVEGKDVGSTEDSNKFLVKENFEMKKEVVTSNDVSEMNPLVSGVANCTTTTVKLEESFTPPVDVEVPTEDAVAYDDSHYTPKYEQKEKSEGDFDVLSPMELDEFSPLKAKRTPLSFRPSPPSKEKPGTQTGVPDLFSSPPASALSNITSPVIPAKRSPLPFAMVRKPLQVFDQEQTGATESIVNHENGLEEIGFVKSEGDQLRESHVPPLCQGTGNDGAWQGKEVPRIVEGVYQSGTSDECDVESESAISEEDTMYRENSVEEDFVEGDVRGDNSQSPGIEAGDGPDGGLHGFSFDDLLDRDGQVIKNNKKDGSPQDDESTDVRFETTEEPLEHPYRTSGLHSGTLDTEDLSNGQISNGININQEGTHGRRSLRSRGAQHSCSKCGSLRKIHDCPLESVSNVGEDILVKKELTAEVSIPFAPTPPPQAHSSGLKVRLKLKGPADTLKEAPQTAKQLLASGLLEGHRVRYLGRGGEVLLTGIIQDGGVLCDCKECEGLEVVNVSAFEKHAGSSARHPSDFIFLENGKCLKDILEVGWNAVEHDLSVLDVIKAAIGEVGSNNLKSKSCSKCGLREGELVSCSRPKCLNVCHPGCSGVVEGDWLCHKCERAEKKPRISSLDTKARMTQSFDTKPRVTEGRAALIREGSTREKELVSSPSLTREASGPNLHKALFLPGGLPDDCELGYYVKGQRFLSGVKKGAGICCSCCEQVISCTLFEQHAGWGSRRNPYGSIYLPDGRSLHAAAQSLVVGQQIVKQEGSAALKVENVDYCNECGDGGDLLLCDDCPNSYHRDCFGQGDVPSGDFLCPECQQQRFGGTRDRRRAVGKRRTKGGTKTLLTKDRVTGRCTRLLNITESVTIGGCVFCKSGDFAKSGFGPMTILLCDQCEREYHVGCLKEHGLDDLKELPEGEWFCGQDCKHIHSILSLLVANGPEPLADSIISKVLESRPRQGKADEEAESSGPSSEWQLLHGRRGESANGKTLAEAVQIFSECFDPIVDGMSGGDLIPLMVYRRSIRDQEFGGMYCVVLKRNDKVVSTALIRIFGRQLAEVPLVATSVTFQGQGHCKALLLSIERLLGVLRVEKLVLPAAEGAEDIWLHKFGFTHMPNRRVEQFRSDLNMMFFTGSSMLEKDIAPLEIYR